MTIDELLSDHEGGHSDLQMDSFITIRSGGTLYGCYKQALRELAKRKRGVDGLEVERDLLLIDIEEIRSTEDHGDFKSRRETVRLRQCLARLAELDRSLTDTRRELDRFFAQAVALKALIGDLTPERRAALDAEMWVHRLKCQAAIDYMSTGRLGPNTAALMQALPRALRDQLPRVKPPELVEWFLAYDPPVPEITVPLRLAESA